MRAGLDADAYVGNDRDWYDGVIRGMDAEVGRLVERLASLGLDKRTLLVLSTDHGEEFLEHGRTFHGQSVYGEQINMPLVFWGPGWVRPDVKGDDTVQVVDICPPCWTRAGCPRPPGCTAAAWCRSCSHGPGGCAPPTGRTGRPSRRR